MSARCPWSITPRRPRRAARGQRARRAASCASSTSCTAMMLRTLTTAIVIGSATAQLPTFPRYNIYPNVSPPQRSLGCLIPDWINGTRQVEIATMICDQDENCKQFGDYNARHIGFNAWTAATGTVTYVSTARCGNQLAPPGKVTPPSCAATKGSGRPFPKPPGYFTCANGTNGGRLTAIATYKLPPQQIKTACDTNAVGCVAFTTDAIGSTGTMCVAAAEPFHEPPRLTVHSELRLDCCCRVVPIDAAPPTASYTDTDTPTPLPRPPRPPLPSLPSLRRHYGQASRFSPPTTQRPQRRQASRFSPTTTPRQVHSTHPGDTSILCATDRLTRCATMCIS
jgi:hypothetical protein